jgi:ubiquitin C-terminal hydrolase
MKLPVFPNLGNTCYLSCVLQCFIYHKHTIDKETPFTLEFQKIKQYVDLTKNDEHIANLYNLKDLIKVLPFKQFEQQDCHECILYFLEHLPGPVYHGETKTLICCLNCNKTKMIFEDFNSINLTIPLEKSQLTDLMLDYLKKETHNHPDNLYFCEHCKSKTKYTKKISLHRLPKILIIVLKRYTFNGTKIGSEVVYNNVLHIKESISGQVKKYTLTSIINHVGDLYNGHYTNYICINDMWLFVDDEHVSPKNYDHRDTYILFYSS